MHGPSLSANPARSLLGRAVAAGTALSREMRQLHLAAPLPGTSTILTDTTH